MASTSIAVILVVCLVSYCQSSGQQYHEPDSLTLISNYDEVKFVEAPDAHFRARRSDDEDIGKLKKAITKKPTDFIKQKPVTAIKVTANANGGHSDHGAPSAPSTPTSASSSSSSSSSSPVSSTSSPTISSSIVTTSTTEEPLVHPDDVTLPPNSTTDEDHTHAYYNSSVITDPQEAMKHWANLTGQSGVEHFTHDMLSNSHRRAATMQLKFTFPFYGHAIKNVTIATGGFLYLGDTVHSWLAATQYIAPLMANFDTSISNESSIKYVNNDTHFIVQWNDVELQDSTPPGNFSFQVTLFKDGDIVFAYKQLPMPIEAIPETKHPVKVGISDAYVIDRTTFFIRRKTIYEYHRADLKKEKLSNNTAIYFKALPTCVSLASCEDCTSAKLTLDCKWCSKVDRCSDGFDRHRQDWLTQGCDGGAATGALPELLAQCSNGTESNRSAGASAGDKSRSDHHAGESQMNKVDGPVDPKAGGHGAKVGVVTLLVIVALLSGVGLWVFWAYKNPQTGAGQFLIKYRPTEWQWRQNETRYTAASIHM
ncbi:Plexin domain-containing protein 2 [Halotydeus destructor]|nr:Plexin domain-containing protein 2 [Halotydeus destructor]